MCHINANKPLRLPVNQLPLLPSYAVVSIVQLHPGRLTDFPYATQSRRYSIISDV